MAQQEEGNIRKLFFQQVIAGVEIVHHPVPTALGAEVQPRPAGGHGAAVPQVVVTRHGKAPGREVLRQGLVPQNVLRHAVGDLQHRPGMALRQPLHRVNTGLSVGGGEGKLIPRHLDSTSCTSNSPLDHTIFAGKAPVRIFRFPERTL